MDIVLRGAAIYLFLLLLFRISGARSLAQITTFDFVLLLIIAEAVQQGLLAEDFSLTNAFVLVIVLVGIDIALSLAKEYSGRFARLIDGVPLVIVEDGRPLQQRMDKARVDLSDVLAAARGTQGIGRLDDIQYAVLERGGSISVIPKRA